MPKIVIAIVAAVILAGAVAAWYFTRGTSSSSEVNALVEEIRASGAPATLSELDAFYDRGQGAGETGNTLATLLGMIRPISDSEELLVVSAIDSDAEIPDQLVNDTRRYMGDHRDISTRLHEIFASSPKVRYPVDLKLGPDAPLEYLAHIRSGTRLLAQEAIVAAVDGNAARSLRALQSGLRLADSLRDEPLVISQLVRIACLAVTFNAIEESAIRCEFDANQLTTLQQELEKIQPDGRMAHALVGERSWGLAEVIGEKAYGRPTVDVWREVLTQNNLDDTKFDSQPYLRAEVAQLTRDYNEAIELGKLAPWEHLEAADRMIEAVNARSDDGNLLSKTLLPQLLRTYEAEVHLIASTECARTGIALARHRRDKKALPATLDELAPRSIAEIPTDPFSGTKLRYRATPANAVVYSVGPDGIDDRGQPPPDGTRIGESGDIAFRLVTN